jgi:SAM-dependent methyltransferase
VSLEKARLYEKYRLPYAAEMADDVLEQTGRILAAADVGSGTGQLARLFARKGIRVHAVEPDPAMRQVAAEASDGCPNISMVDACAEQTTLPENSVDLILIGNALHRFKPEAVHELLRILRPSGWVAVVSYVFDHQSYAELLFPKLGRLESIAARSKLSWHRMPVESLFGGRPYRTLDYAQSLAEDWEAFWGAARAGIEAPGPQDEDFAQFEGIHREVFDAFAVDGRIRIDYKTRVHLGQPGP